MRQLPFSQAQMPALTSPLALVKWFHVVRCGLPSSRRSARGWSYSGVGNCRRNSVMVGVVIVVSLAAGLDILLHHLQGQGAVECRLDFKGDTLCDSDITKAASTNWFARRRWRPISCPSSF